MHEPDWNMLFQLELSPVHSVYTVTLNRFRILFSANRRLYFRDVVSKVLIG